MGIGALRRHLENRGYNERQERQREGQQEKVLTPEEEAYVQEKVKAALEDIKKDPNGDITADEIAESFTAPKLKRAKKVKEPEVEIKSE